MSNYCNVGAYTNRYAHRVQRVLTLVLIRSNRWYLFVTCVQSLVHIRSIRNNFSGFPVAQCDLNFSLQLFNLNPIKYRQSHYSSLRILSPHGLKPKFDAFPLT